MAACLALSHLGKSPQQIFDENIQIGQMFGGKINRAWLLGGREINGHSMPEIA